MSTKYKGCPRWRSHFHVIIHWAKEHNYANSPYRKRVGWGTKGYTVVRKPFVMSWHCKVCDVTNDDSKLPCPDCGQTCSQQYGEEMHAHMLYFMDPKREEK